MTPALEARDIVVIRGERALVRDVSLTTHAGELVVLVGPNGAGKSTLLGVLSGDIVPDRGEVSLHGRRLQSVPVREQARARAVLPQQTVLQFAFPARDVVAMGRTPLPATGRAADDAAIDLAMDATEMASFANRAYPRLSGGEQHRISMSRVLAQETPILILDEPTAALDIRHQHLVMSRARETARQGGTVIAVLHDLNLAVTYADRVGVMFDGELVACDEPWSIAQEDLLSDVFDYPITVTHDTFCGRPVIVSNVAPTPATR